MENSVNLEAYFELIRQGIIGNDAEFDSPYGKQKIIYADWIASGRLFGPIENRLSNIIGPYVANTHTETTFTGNSMTHAYHHAIQFIKKHVGANDSDILISTGSGMTGVVNKLQRMLGLRIHERFTNQIDLKDDERPIVFITHMEHHSNQTTWLETIADVEIIKPTADGLVDLHHFSELLEKYKNRVLKIAAVTSCSNVTGVFTPYFEMARMIHDFKGLCFVDFACSAPYIDIVMRPENPKEHLDAIYFSPHKFLGGPGSSGILVFDPSLYTNKIPDNPGGGTVEWTNPWGEHRYIDDIESREDGGTPGFMQTIRAAYSMQLKEEIGTKAILAREHELIDLVWDKLKSTPKLHLLAENIKDRLAVLSFYADDIHYNLIVKLLNDRFGVQVRGGCSCAGTYGHYLLHVRPEFSKMITRKIDSGDRSMKPGWVRFSLHPSITNEEALNTVYAIQQVIEHAKEWVNDYEYDGSKNEFFHKSGSNEITTCVSSWFKPLTVL
ncbi:MAG: aminotransferase class V-fold PLP-dependent enzyme [Bacteroidetes bacterium]|nr:aminotransferase class V-fold PLP-dependent enzyme [Bacteroidota bacterium]